MRVGGVNVLLRIAALWLMDRLGPRPLPLISEIYPLKVRGTRDGERRLNAVVGRRPQTSGLGSQPTAFSSSDLFIFERPSTPRRLASA